MKHTNRLISAFLLWLGGLLVAAVAAGPQVDDGLPAKLVVRQDDTSPNLLADDGWRAWKKGFRRDADLLICDNGDDTETESGASQHIVLNQQSPSPIVAVASSRSQDVSGSADSNYSLYLDITFNDGTHQWGQHAAFDSGTHAWQTRRVLILPDKPVQSVSLHLLLRGHSGKAWFRDAQLHTPETPANATRFDGVAVVPVPPAIAGFQLRDVSTDSDYVHISNGALGLTLSSTETRGDGASFFDVRLRDTTGRDRAVTLIYSVPVAPGGLRWFEDPRRSTDVAPQTEYVFASRFEVGSNGRLSKYPFAAVANSGAGHALGIDMDYPAFFRAGYNASTSELFLAYDLGFTAEQPEVRLRFCKFHFDAGSGFRGALARYYALFPAHFECRVTQQGLWMPFAKISDVEAWEDFGFKFKEGNNETAWDDAHEIVTFRYTEPMTWWMRMPIERPRSMESALELARTLAEEQGVAAAQALFNSGFHDEHGQLVAKLLDTPWCNGAVWSMNSMPGIKGTPNDFSTKWNRRLESQLYAAAATARLDGEYVDSSEGYVTAELDYRRDHFAAAATPLCFAMHTHRPAIFRGLVAFEYVRGLARDVHAQDRLMMANSTPSRLCWLAPQLDVLGTETNWNPNGRWQPMGDADLLYRRAMSGGKPFCFLMNTEFEQFSQDHVAKYMKRCLAYGMFPGFFSHNASQGHYFTRPELYNRDRPLFKKYIPVIRQLAEAGWQPLTRVQTLDQRILAERFGDRFVTMFNPGSERLTFRVRLAGMEARPCRELLSDEIVTWRNGETTWTLEGEDVAVLCFADER